VSCWPWNSRTSAGTTAALRAHATWNQAQSARPEQRLQQHVQLCHWRPKGEVDPSTAGRSKHTDSHPLAHAGRAHRQGRHAATRRCAADCCSKDATWPTALSVATGMEGSHAALAQTTRGRNKGMALLCSALGGPLAVIVHGAWFMHPHPPRTPRAVYPRCPAAGNSLGPLRRHLLRKRYTTPSMCYVLAATADKHRMLPDQARVTSPACAESCCSPHHHSEAVLSHNKQPPQAKPCIWSSYHPSNTFWWCTPAPSFCCLLCKPLPAAALTTPVG
jgi:hypothetical protein